MKKIEDGIIANEQRIYRSTGCRDCGLCSLALEEVTSELDGGLGQTQYHLVKIISSQN
jgi:hypothetical protein